MVYAFRNHYVPSTIEVMICVVLHLILWGWEDLDCTMHITIAEKRRDKSRTDNDRHQLN